MRQQDLANLQGSICSALFFNYFITFFISLSLLSLPHVYVCVFKKITYTLYYRYPINSHSMSSDAINLELPCTVCRRIRIRSRHLLERGGKGRGARRKEEEVVDWILEGHPSWEAAFLKAQLSYASEVLFYYPGLIAQ